jgi:hypothetical protein
VDFNEPGRTIGQCDREAYERDPTNGLCGRKVGDWRATANYQSGAIDKCGLTIADFGLIWGFLEKSGAEIGGGELVWPYQ